MAILVHQSIYTTRQHLGSFQPTTKPLHTTDLDNNNNNDNDMSEPGECTRRVSGCFICDARNRTDYPVLLNNLLQSQPGGSVAPHLRYMFDREGPDHNATHVAMAMCEHHAHRVKYGVV